MSLLVYSTRVAASLGQSGSLVPQKFCALTDFNKSKGDIVRY
jgi:hypothetical protein